MRLFRRASSRQGPAGEMAAEPEILDRAAEPPNPTEISPPASPVAEIRVSRTLVKSEPELAELVEREPRLKDERVDVTLVEKGFGTRVAIVAEAGKGLEQADLEQLLDQLAQPQKRPFSNA